MEIHAIQGDKCTHVLTAHRTDSHEIGPLHLIIPAKVAYWMQRDVDYDALMASLSGTENNLAEDCQSAPQPVDSTG